MKIGVLYIDLSVVNPTEEDRKVLKETDFFCDNVLEDSYGTGEIELWKTGREFYAEDNPDISGFLAEFKALCDKYNGIVSY